MKNFLESLQRRKPSEPEATPLPLNMLALLGLVDQTLAPIKQGRGVWANVFGIGGTGKTTFINELEAHCQNEGIRTTAIKIPSLSDDRGEEQFAGGLVRQLRKLQRGRSGRPQVVTIDDLDTLAWERQKEVLYAADNLSHRPGTAVITATHNRPAFPTFEMKQRCDRFQLPGIPLEAIRPAVGGDESLAKLIAELSGGHPATTAAMIGIAREHTAIAVRTSSETEMEPDFLDALETGIERNLARLNSPWDQQLLMLIAPAVTFGPELIEKIEERLPLPVPPSEHLSGTSVAWNFRNSGLVNWNIGESAYIIEPNLRHRINQAMQRRHPEGYQRVENIIAQAGSQ